MELCPELDISIPVGKDSLSMQARWNAGDGSAQQNVAPVSLVTYLCSAIGLKIGQNAIERLQFIENIHDEWGDHVPGDL